MSMAEEKSMGQQSEQINFFEADSSFSTPVGLMTARSLQNINSLGYSEMGTPPNVRRDNNNPILNRYNNNNNIMMARQISDPYGAQCAGDLATPVREKRYFSKGPPKNQRITGTSEENGNYIYTNNMKNARSISNEDITASLNGFHYRKKHCRSNYGDSQVGSPATSFSPRFFNGGPNKFISPSARSVSSFSMHQSECDQDTPKASTRKEKHKLTRRYFATVFSISYAIFLVVFGAIIFIGDAVASQYPLPQVFCIYMLVAAFAYFLFLYTDIRLHVHRAKSAIKKREERQKLIEEYLNKLNVEFEGPFDLKDFGVNNNYYHRAIRELNLPPLKPISHRFCFLTGRQGECLYLKLGAAWFAFGLLIHSILQISYQIFFLSSNGEDFYTCASYITLALDVLFPVYSLFTLFFIVKYMNVIINEHRGLARLFLMHAIGTSLAFWVFTIVRETADAIARSDSDEYERYKVAEPNETLTFVYHDCGKSIALNMIHRQFSPYLYPFIIEYCILLSGIWYSIYANINLCPRKLSALGHGNDTKSSRGAGSIGTSDAHSLCSSSSSDHCGTTTDHENDFKTNSFVYADCQASFRGIFAGLLLLIMTIVFIILMFVGVENETYLKTSITVNKFFELIVLLVMIFSTFLAYLQIIQLDINHHPISILDDILLFAAVPAFFMETVFSLAPAIYNHSMLRIGISVAQIIQVLIQTSFIIDGLRRCSNAVQLRKKKPGRELVIFLTIANISLWIFYTFSVKTAYTGDVRYEFYGYTLWNILNHITQPMIMFYRFHASVCLVDIWKNAYEPAPFVEN